jgi:hypothetical protein
MIAIGNIPAFASDVDVGVSISIGQPGFYGRIDIGNAPQPELIYAQPVVIQPVPRGRVYQPIYLRVPPGHEKNWKKHCRKYDACGRPVYFVREKWYEDVYVPHYKKQGKKRGGGDRRGRERDRERRRGHDRD